MCEVCEVRRGTHSNDEKRPQAWPSWQRLGACAAGAAPFAHTYAICNRKAGQVIDHSQVRQGCNAAALARFSSLRARHQGRASPPACRSSLASCHPTQDRPSAP